MLVYTLMSEPDPSPPSHTYFQLVPDFPHIDDKMLHLTFGALYAVCHLSKRKNVIRRTALHIASQLTVHVQWFLVH